jgi:TRAP transporter TAXI family solute receptor
MAGRSLPGVFPAAFWLAVLLALPWGFAAQARELVTIGAAPLGGSYYPTAVGLADLITKYGGVDARVEVTGGTVDNPLLMEQGELQLGLANTDMAYFAYEGKAPFPGKFSSLRALFTGLAPGTVQYVVQDGSGLKSIRDLKGRRVAVGPQGNSSGLLFLKILAFYGLRPSDVSLSFLSFSDGVNEMVSGHVDMAIVQAGLPSPGLQEVFAGSGRIRILSFPQADLDAFLQEHPYYAPMRITKNHYPQLAEEVNTFATSNMVLVRSSVPAETVRAITAAVFDHLDDFRATHPPARSVTLEKAADVPIPLHEGAARYFREKGVLKK